MRKIDNKPVRTRSNSEDVKKIIEVTGFRPIGGERYQERKSTFNKVKEARLFLPWAAPADGRTELRDPEVHTLQWLFGENSLTGTLEELFGVVSYMVMFADEYAQENGFDMNAARIYWSNVREAVPSSVDASYTSTTELNDQQMLDLRLKNAYALEKLDPIYQTRILSAAKKYSGGESEIDTYQAAAQYCMRRAAEAEYVDEQLDALWVSLNWPERDIMCGNVPRLYVPTDIRTPWLKSE